MANMKQTLEKARKELKQAHIDLSHDRMHNNRISKVKSCTEEVIKLHVIEEQVLLQRSKIDWLRMSDDNMVVSMLLSRPSMRIRV